MPVDDFGDVLRIVPGVNVSQISARDVQVNTRGATNSLANRQLVLLDGRTVYLDFFGFVMWDLLPHRHATRSPRSRWCADRAARCGAPTPSAAWST